MTVLQNFYEETITASLATGTGKMYVSGKPIADATSGWVVINPGNTSRREIVAFDAIGTDGSGDFIELSERGVGGTTEQTHEVGEPVRLNITAEHWKDLVDLVDAAIPDSFIDTDGTLAADSDEKIPSQKAIKTYSDNTKIAIEGNQDVNGVKTFSESPIVPEPTTDSQAATKKYADDIAVAGAPNAGETTKGLVEIATDAQIAAGTDVGETGAFLVVVPSKIPNGLTNAFTTKTTWNPLTGLSGTNIVSTIVEITNGYVEVLVDAVSQGTFISSFSKLFNVTSSLSIVSKLKPKVSSATYDSVSFSVSTQDSTPEAIQFSTDGTEMYIVGGAGDTIEQYTLSTAWDLSTASTTNSLPVSSQDNNPKGICFANSGTKMYMLGDDNNRFYEYTLSTAWDLSTASYIRNNSVSNQASQPRACWMSEDGTKVLVTDNNGGTIYEYSLGTPYNVAGFTYTGNTLGAGFTEGLSFDATGTIMYGVNLSDQVLAYSLSTAFDITTATSLGPLFSLSGQDTLTKGVVLGDGDTKMYMLGDQNNRVYQYTVPGDGTVDILARVTK